MKAESEELSTLLSKGVEPIFWIPERLNFKSGWWAHVPFAFWITVTCRPRLLVELGTHHGVSYAAFCEAVARSQLGTRCYAVDTWAGDAHAGFYDDSAYLDFKNFHDQRYAAFSELLRTTFDRASGFFEDNTVDLLHIDGYHTYEVVRHDFETWKSKLSERAVVLFHDTNVRKHNFGVWRFFAELRRELPTFEFLHGHGLGVVAVGADPPAAVRQICELDDRSASVLRTRFAHLGARWTAVIEAEESKSLEKQLTDLRDVHNRMIADHAATVSTLNSLDKELKDLRDVQARTVADHAAADAQLNAALTEAREALIRTMAERDQAARGIKILEDELANSQQRNEEQKQDAALAHQLLASHSWRLTRPLRFATRLVRNDWGAVRAGVRPVFLRTANTIGRRLPLNAARKQRLASLAYRMAGSLFEGSAGYESWRAYLQGLELPCSDHPLISILIPAYGQLAQTATCLRSIMKHPPAVPIEVLVIEDHSGDPSIRALAGVPGLRYQENAKNLGFLRSCNRAATFARGEYLHLLNNDTEVTEGWLDAMIDIFKLVPDCGLVGSKLLFPDGRLQEAGCIVWDDASVCNYGREDNSEKPEYNYLRDADYISAASILVPRALWERLGGFDENFVPAYYEDADFAFRLRQAGFHIIYQPSSVVIHREGVSHGTDLNSGVKAYLLENRTRMKEKWRPTLQADHYRSGDRIMRARDRSERRRTMLVIDRTVPEPDRDAGSRCMLELMKNIQIDDWVIKFWPDNLRCDPVYTVKLQQMGIETFYHPWTTSFDDWLATYCSDIDAVFLTCPAIAPRYLASLKNIVSNAPVIFFGHDLHSERIRIQSRITNDPSLEIEAEKIEAIERMIWHEVDVILYPSQEEVDHVNQLDPSVDARALLPYCFDNFGALRMPPSSRLILFDAGFTDPPDVDAATWLAQEIMPLVRREIPDASLRVGSANQVTAVKDLANHFIQVTGYISPEELAAIYSEARASVAPLRFGGGIKLKVVEALREGVPLVTTPVGAQGLEGLSEVVAVSRNAETIAATIVQLLSDDGKWTDQAQRQDHYAKAHFSRDAFRSAISEALRAAFARAKTRNTRSDAA